MPVASEPAALHDDEVASDPVSKEVAARLARELRQLAQQATTEEDLRIAAEARLGDALYRLGIPCRPSYERTYANHAGRSDAVYGRVVIEYEPVGALRTGAGVDHAAEQLERYLRAEAESAANFDALQRVVGVGLDGHSIFFLRFRGAIDDNEPELYVAPGQGILPLEDDPTLFGHLSPVLDGPYPVSTESIQTFLLYLRAANRSRLTPEGLAKQFGPDGPCAANVVTALANLFRQHKDDSHVSTFFQEWDRIFGIVYGVDLNRANRHLPILQTAYGLDSGLSLKVGLFAVHTYYALLMKLLAAELVAMQRESLIGSYLNGLPSASDEKLHRAIDKVESGELFAQFAVQNFLEADFFGWYLAVWSTEISDAIREMVRLLVTFEPATGALEPRPTQDLLKRLYQYLVPREIRHDLGEFYTPNWLADLAIRESGYDAELGTRVLDPACGSGTFLVNIINRLRVSAQANDVESSDVAKSILKDVVGFELNPLAVIAARTNYLLALGPLLRELPLVEIPVYLCDSILAPTATDMGLLGEEYELRTSVGAFLIPTSIVDSGQLAVLTGLLDRCLQDSYTADEFGQVAEAELALGDQADPSVFVNLYKSLLRLKEQGKDGIWARIIRNAFAPLTCGLFDFVIGNPPWVNWQSLSPEYRAATLKFWTDYGLFSLSGHAARLGGGKKDISALMFYRSADAYLRGGGRLAFLITQTLFKSKGAGDGFRRFRLGDRAKLGVRIVHDLTKLQPFEGATTQTALIVVQKGVETTYPVQYISWRKAGRFAGMSTAPLGTVQAACTTELLSAAPVDISRPTSPWLTASPGVGGAVREIVGKSEYRAFAGVCTWANGIYWLGVQDQTANGLIRIRNLADEAKEKNVEAKDALVEKTHVYPLVRSRDIRRWNAIPSAYILVPQDPNTKRGIPESVLRVQASRTYRYLKSFEGQLSDRSGMLKYFDSSKGDAFYSVYNVSNGTFVDYKVMWRQMVPHITAAVVGPRHDSYLGDVSAVTQHVVSVIATSGEEEAHYVCAMLNSSVATSISASYSTGKSYGTPSMLDHVPIPKFDGNEENHRQLAALSRQAHELASSGRPTIDVEDEVDQVAARVFGVDSSHLPALEQFVSTLRRRSMQLDIVDVDEEP